MSGDFNVAADASVNMSAGTAGAVGSGGYTIAVLVRPTAGNNNCGFVRCDAAGTQQRGFFEDALALFGANDFSSGFGALTQGNWYLCAQSKAAGSNLYRFHVWAYAADGSGTMSHGTSTGAANQGDGSTIDAIRIGIADDRGNGLIAVAGFWTRALSDAELDSMKSGSLASWANVSGGAPAELISLENWNGTSGATAVVGTSSQSSITGTVGAGANPPSFDFAVATTIATSGAQALPPHLLYQLAARNQAMWANAAAVDNASAIASEAVAALTAGDAAVDVQVNAAEATAAITAADASAAVAAGAEQPTAVFAAFDATVSTSGSTNAPADVAVWSMSAPDAAASTGAPAGVSTAAMSADNPTPDVGPNPDPAALALAAFDITTAVATAATPATAVFAAFDATVVTGTPGSASADVAVFALAAFDAHIRKGTVRPAAGSTTRPGPGTTLRPYAGTTARP